MTNGKITQIIGTVVDVEFESGHVPELYTALEVLRPDKTKVVFEVARHLGYGQVRAIALASNFAPSLRAVGEIGWGQTADRHAGGTIENPLHSVKHTRPRKGSLLIIRTLVFKFS